MLTAIALSTAAFASSTVATFVPQWQAPSNQKPNLYTATDAAAVHAAQATAKAESPTSRVPGKAFDRFAVIWMENTDFDKAAGDPNLAWLATKGQVLSNYFAVTHPSEPNYAAAIAGDNFGIDNDAFNQISGNVSTIVDLLEDRGISWAMYQEDMPYAGFEGMQWKNQQTGANDYVRKHNPAILYNANTTPDRLANNKNFTSFYSDLENDSLPQWMFITPNMTSDGHDTSVTVAGSFMRSFVEPLLNDTRFMKNTLVLITFDENHTYTLSNRVFSILLGDALPQDKIGSTDDMYYNHYSELSTVESNWNLATLGRWDVGANVFQTVADKTGAKSTPWEAATGASPTRFFNESFAGPFNSVNSSVPYPVPNSLLVRDGRFVSPKVSLTWGLEEFDQKSYYADTVEIPDGMYPPAGWAS
ncbi:hypothetical protein AAFC00_006386 [Neodothiora populina]